MQGSLAGSGQQGMNELHQLFLQDQQALNCAAGPASLSTQLSSSQQALGWGGQPINDSNRFRVPWFGRRRGAAAHRQRQARTETASACRDVAESARTPLPSAHAASVPSGSDNMSVEELVQLLKRTPRSDPVPQRVYRALHHLDSRTVALLLKDVSKAGLDSRSIEVFDWLRSLPERHLLRQLCDVFTYTAMISLCIYQQNIDRAMELLEEMRQRGVERNVHTYTALMNVCIKCGKLTAALDIFATMKTEGCIPNVVTYNTLIDVHGKLGQWDKAVSVLSMMRAEGVPPALRTFNTLIIACNMCNQPREALAVYQELRDSGFEANSTTFNALISAYGKLGQLDRVLEVYREMVYRGLDRSVITYSSLISACEKAGRWQTALELFDEMQRDGCTPNTVTYNSLITACGQGAQWERARQVFEQMQSKGCMPDVVTYTALISAHERGGQWQLALEAFEEMVGRGCRPDGIIYNAIIDALWQTGVIWAQAKAKELFAVAVKQGHFRNERLTPDNSRAELNLHALTAGVAMLSLQGWLADIQHKVSSMGDSSLPPLVAIITDAGSASKEQGNFIIKDAASTCMSFWGSPFRAVQDKTYLGVLEATGPQLAAWVRSSTFGAMMVSLFPPTIDAGPLPPQLLRQREVAAQNECREAFDAVQRFEASHNLALQNMGVAYLQQRGGLVSSIVEKGGALGLRDEVVHDAVLLLDRTASTGVQMPQELLPVVAAAALHLSMQQGGAVPGDPPQPSMTSLAATWGVEPQSVVDMCWQLRQVLQDDTMAISAMRCLKVYLERMGCRHLDRQGMYVLAGLPIMLAVEALFDMSLLNCRPSVVAAGLLYAERRQRGAVPFWPSMLAKMTGYEDLTTPELACAVRTAQKLCKKVLYTQIYKSQSTNLAAQLSGLPDYMQQPQQQQQQPGSMQADAVVAAPQLAKAASSCLPPISLSLQSSLSGPLSAKAFSVTSTVSSSASGAVGTCMGAAMTPAGATVPVSSSVAPTGSVVGAAVLAAPQQGRLDLSLLAQLQLQQEAEQQQQQQGASLTSLAMSGLLTPSGLTGRGSVPLNGMVQPNANLQLDMPLMPVGSAVADRAAALRSSAPTGLGPAPVAGTGNCLLGASAMGVGGLNGRLTGLGASPFAAVFQPTLLRQQQHEQQDVVGLENLAFSLSALGINGPADSQMSAAALEAALRQQ